MTHTRLVTAANDRPHVEVAFSANGGASFERPAIVDGGTSAGRASATLISSDEAIVTWVERKSNTAKLLARRVSSGGEMGSPVEIASGGVREIGFPRIAAAGENALVAWTSSLEATRVQIAWLKSGR